MLVFVVHNETEEPFLLLGTGVGMYRSEDANKIFNRVTEGVYKMIAVCDKSGKIYWYPSDQLTVVTVDGKELRDHWL